ncbi:hypothetical protein DOM22_08565 [Bdellovibrio sp. ZAP7]|uniref:hypothetical protein n=1 Tax=Bdellovibrio sp. ZAP7 TaxID=2231053 RepID=UPI00115C2841|nr:hypothetical protein [Bdellovibrio sp. ZAP7]QDK45205.1 hypothetical protein DOM22_08565 [Bdellovibrio sp. ZAP7]
MRFLLGTMMAATVLSGCDFKFDSLEATKEVKAVKAEMAFLNNLQEPQTAIVYSLDPTQKGDGATDFHGFKVLGEIKLNPEDVTEAALEFKDAAESFKDGLALPGCFNPRYGIRVTKGGKTYDYALSYECNHLRGYDGGKVYDFDAAGNPRVLKDLFTNANIPQSTPPATTPTPTSSITEAK